MPAFFEEDDYELKITLKSRDYPDYLAEHMIVLAPDKKEHDVYFGKAEIKPAFIECSGEIEANLNIINRGGNDEGILISIENSELGIDEESKVNLHEGDSLPLNYNFNIHSGMIKSGNYTINMNIYSSRGVLFDKKKAVVSFIGCLPERISLTSEKLTLGNGRLVGRSIASLLPRINRNDALAVIIIALLAGILIVAILIILFSGRRRV